MNQNRIGEFIQRSRKEKGWTQKELAEQIGVSDKTISKWENGNSVPDTGILTSLCEVLEISVNELISGEKLPSEDYTKKAEENIMNLLQENQERKKLFKKQYAAGIFIVLLAVGFMCITCTVKLGWYLDVPSLLTPTLLCIGIVLLSGRYKWQEVIAVLRKIVLPAGLVSSLFQFVCAMGKIEDLSTIGPNLAMCVLTLFYSSVAYLIFFTMEQQKKA